MSSILFPSSYYNHLEKHSQLANDLFFQKRSIYVPEQPLLSEFLFELNVEAYRLRYGHRDDVEDDIRDAREYDVVDLADLGDDSDWGKVTDWNNMPQIWQLLCRIRYQCEEFDDNHPAQQRLRVLNWMIELLVEMQMERLTAAIGSGELAKPLYQYERK